MSVRRCSLWRVAFGNLPGMSAAYSRFRSVPVGHGIIRAQVFFCWYCDNGGRIFRFGDYRFAIAIRYLIARLLDTG